MSLFRTGFELPSVRVGYQQTLVVDFLNDTVLRVPYIDQAAAQDYIEKKQSEIKSFYVREYIV
jgi:hypothetical protein